MAIIPSLELMGMYEEADSHETNSVKSSNSAFQKIGIPLEECRVWYCHVIRRATLPLIRFNLDEVLNGRDILSFL